jgi:hypothetical protein
VVLGSHSLFIFVHVLAPLFVIAATQTKPRFAPLQSLITKAIFWVCGKEAYVFIKVDHFVGDGPKY